MDLSVTMHQGLLLLFPKDKMVRRQMRRPPPFPQSRADQQIWIPWTIGWTGATSSDFWLVAEVVQKTSFLRRKA